MKPKSWCFQVNKIDKLRLKLTQKEIDNLRNPMPIKQIEFIPNFPHRKCQGQSSSLGNSTTYVRTCNTITSQVTV